jgi:hypothetical protein
MKETSAPSPQSEALNLDVTETTARAVMSCYAPSRGCRATRSTSPRRTSRMPGADGAGTRIRLSPFLLDGEEGLLNLVNDTEIRIAPAALSILRDLGPVFTEEEVIARLGAPRDAGLRFVATLREKNVLVRDTPDLWRQSVIRYVDVEISSHCNARCRFCPVAADPLPRRLMAQDVFARILDAVASAPVQWVSLNHYNEPTLDPGFLDKVRLLAERHLALRLFTNATRLTAVMAAELVRLGNVDEVVVNLPSVDPAEYRERMGIRMFPDLLDRLVAAARLALPLNICVNGEPAAARRNLDRITAWFAAAGVTVRGYVNATHDRAGLLGAGGDVLVSGRWLGGLGGCRRVFEHLSVNVEGKVFLCCQDYHQEHVLGDLLSQSLDDILRGEEATRLRRQIFGDLGAPESFICRSCLELNRR